MVKVRYWAVGDDQLGVVVRLLSNVDVATNRKLGGGQSLSPSSLRFWGGAQLLSNHGEFIGGKS